MFENERQRTQTVAAAAAVADAELSGSLTQSAVYFKQQGAASQRLSVMHLQAIAVFFS